MSKGSSTKHSLDQESSELEELAGASCTDSPLLGNGLHLQIGPRVPASSLQGTSQVTKMSSDLPEATDEFQDPALYCLNKLGCCGWACNVAASSNRTSDGVWCMPACIISSLQLLLGMLICL